MTGPEHYQAAEELLSGLWADRDQSGESRDRDIACAQAHATLALAAATVTTRAFGPQEMWGGHLIECSGEWQAATS